MMHTDECLAYAATTRQPFCIADCKDVRMKRGADVKRLVQRLREAKEAIESLDEGALGYSSDGFSKWPIKAEMLDYISRALAPFVESE